MFGQSNLIIVTRLRSCSTVVGYMVNLTIVSCLVSGHYVGNCNKTLLQSNILVPGVNLKSDT